MVIVCNSEAESLAGLVNSGLMRNFGEFSVAIIVKQQHRLRLEEIGMTIRAKTLFAMPAVDVVKVPLHITGDDQIEPTIIVIVDPCRAGHPSGAGDTRTCCHIGK